MSTLPQITGDLLNALLRIVKELGLPLLVAAILLLLLPSWIAAAAFLTFPLLLAIVILLACVTVFAPAPWLVHVAKALVAWGRSWLLYLTLSDRQKRLLGPFAMVEMSDYWMLANDEDVQRLLDHKFLFQAGPVINGVLNLRASIPKSKLFVDRFRPYLRKRWVRGASDAVGKALDAMAIEANQRRQTRI